MDCIRYTNRKSQKCSKGQFKMYVLSLEGGKVLQSVPDCDWLSRKEGVFKNHEISFQDVKRSSFVNPANTMFL